jgi:hypothetical protein
MPQHDDLQFLVVAAATPKNNQLKHASKRNVADGQEHEASDVNKPRLFYGNRICAPHSVLLERTPCSERHATMPFRSHVATANGAVVDYDQCVS